MADEERMTAEVLDSLKRRCMPRDGNDNLFVIPIAEVRDLLALVDKQFSEIERQKQITVEYRSTMNVQEAAERDRADAAEARAETARATALEEAAKVCEAHFGKDIESFGLPDKIRSLTPSPEEKPHGR